MRDCGAGDEADTVAVVMATHQRAGYLPSALRALEQQTHRRADVIIVDDGSTDETMEVLEEAERTSGLRLRSVHCDENRGPAAARNVGWRIADAAWIAFTDDDCVPQVDWLDCLLDAARSSGADIVQGRTIPDPTHEKRGCWDRTANITAFSDRYQTCNLLVRRALLDELDGFDASFTFAGEDADFGWRSRAAGAQATFTGAAVVHHAVRPCTFQQHLADRATWADLTKFYKHHPEARGLLVAGVFYRTSHIVVIAGLPVAAVCAAAAGWWVLPCAVASYVGFRAKRHGRSSHTLSRRLLCGAQGVVSVGWEVVQFVRASVRYRTLVL